jgi:hypothetical protein
MPGKQDEAIIFLKIIQKHLPKLKSDLEALLL